MDPNTLIVSLQEALPGAHVDAAPSVDLQTTVYVSRDDLPAIARVLRDRPEFAFAFLAEVTAVDFRPREPRFEVVYVLVSIVNRLRVRVKVRLPGHDPHVATVSDVWPAANWLEREVYDMFGVGFTGHPDRRRILMPDDWQGFPQRKDYPLEGPGELLMENPEDWLKLRQARDQADIE
jgi:NADH-quinone oxidoreductase subunit C